MNAISIKNLNVEIKYKDKNKVMIFNEVNVNVKEGEWVHIKGNNNSGKTLLFRILTNTLYLKRDVQIKGEISVLNRTVFVENLDNEIMKNVSYVQQDVQLISNFTFLENIMAPLLIKGMKMNVAKQKAMAIIKEFDTEFYTNKKIDEISGGKKRLLSILVSLVTDPKLLLIDEPFNNLDKEARLNVVQSLKRLREKKNLTVLMISHEMYFNEFDLIFQIENKSIRQIQ
jgi:ABC-type multidrug transport system ATPase subunit